MRIVVIGAGPGGLAAAHYLQSRFATKPAVRIVDGAAAAGGLASGFRGLPEWDWPLERFYHHLFTNDDHIIDLTQEVGLADLLEVHAPATAYRFASANYRLDSVRNLLAFPHLSLLDKLRMGLTLAYLRWHPRPPWRAFDAVTADSWLRTRMGDLAYETLWRPLLQAKFGPAYPTVSLAWFAARIIKRTPQLIYVKGGFQAWADGLLEANRALGADVHLGTRVSEIVRVGESWEVRSAGGNWAADAVLYTGPPYALCRLCSALPHSFKAQVGQEQYMGAAVLTVALDRALTHGTYWISIPADAQLPFLVLVEHTAMVDRKHYGGHHLCYLGAYVEQNHRYLTMDETALAEEFLAGLQGMAPAFEPRQVLGWWLHRAAYAQPIPVCGFGSRRLSLQTPLKGLYLASMSQVWPWGRGTNYAVEIGQQAAQTMGAELSL